MELLLRWNRTFNLIAKSTQNSIYERHLLDSVQLIPFLNDNENILDFGSGSGMPAIPISIFVNAKISACERIGKKCQFMNEAKRQLGIGDRFQVIQEDIRNLSSLNQTYDVITSRAFADIEDIKLLVKPLLKEGGRFVLLKNDKDLGKISELSEKFNMTFDIKESITSPVGKIIIAQA